MVQVVTSINELRFSGDCACSVETSDRNDEVGKAIMQMDEVTQQNAALGEARRAEDCSLKQHN